MYAKFKRNVPQWGPLAALGSFNPTHDDVAVMNGAPGKVNNYFVEAFLSLNFLRAFSMVAMAKSRSRQPFTSTRLPSRSL
jgi:hypothetical protein